MWKLGMSIDVEELWVLDERINSKAISVLDLCGSSSAAYAVMRDLGFPIKQWDVVESNAKARQVADEIFGDTVKRISDDIATFICEMFYDMVLAGPPCQPWSRRNRYATGFRVVRSEVLEHRSKVIWEAMPINLELKFMLENVVI